VTCAADTETNTQQLRETRASLEETQNGLDSCTYALQTAEKTAESNTDEMLQAHNGERARLQTDLDQATSKLTEESTARKAMAAEKAALVAQTTQLNEKIASLETAAKANSASIASAAAAEAALKKEVSRLQAESKQQREQVKKLTKQSQSFGSSNPTMDLFALPQTDEEIRCAAVRQKTLVPTFNVRRL
jgi:chromosome segregation ATPase